MARRPSAILLVMGICNILMGCLALFCGTCGTGSIVFVTKVAGGPDLIDFLNRRIFGWLFWEIAKHGVSLLLGMLLILGGVGLIMHKRWGWLLTLLCAPVTLLQQLAYVAFQLLFVLPAVNEYQRQMQGMTFTAPGDQGQDVGTILGMLFAASVHSFYALATLVVLLLPTTFRDLRNADRAKKKERWESDEGESEGDDWSRRRRWREE